MKEGRKEERTEGEKEGKRLGQTKMLVTLGPVPAVPLHCLLPWTCYLTSLRPGNLINKMGIVLSPGLLWDSSTYCIKYHETW